jgi:hypothetical protein
MKRVSSLCPLWFVLCCWQAEAQIYDTNNDVVQTFAGSGFSGYVDGQGTQTMFNAPMAIVADTSSNLFVLDCYNYRIRKIAPDGTVSTFLGGGQNLPGYGTNVQLGNLSRPMAIDHSNALWLVEYIYSGGFTLLRAGTDGYVTATFLSVAQNSVGGMCADSGNNIYFSDQGGIKYTATEPTVFWKCLPVQETPARWMATEFLPRSPVRLLSPLMLLIISMFGIRETT